MHSTTFLRDVLPGAISVLAVAISAFSVFRSSHQRRRDVHFDTVSQLYSRFYEIQALKLQYPYLSHLFATADTYPSIKEEVGQILRFADDREIKEYRLRERAVVSTLLTFHEQIVFQWTSAGVRERAFAKEVIDYLETRLFRNPRILWWWTADKVGLSASYEELTKNRWMRYVLSGVDQSSAGWRDPEGPLPIQQQEAECRPSAL